MRINKRLTRVSSYIEDNSNIIDVGCDHALLCIYLVKTLNNINCIATDINSGPLNQARRNIEEFGVSKYIKIKEGFGIDTIEEYIDTIVISGMGGKTIVDILSSGRDKLKNIKRIILSPNSDFYIVRKCITKLGYNIISEEVVMDKNKYYSVMVFEPGNKKYKNKDLYYGTKLLKNEDLYKYYNYLCSKYDEKNKLLPYKYFLKKIKFKIKKIKLIIKIKTIKWEK